MANPSQATVPMFAPDGTLGDIPYERMREAQQAGFVMGVNMLAPDGSKGVIPANRVKEATAANYKTIPYDFSTTGGKIGFLDTAKTIGKNMISGVAEIAKSNAQAAAENPQNPVAFVVLNAAKQFGSAVKSNYAQDATRKAEGYNPVYRALAPAVAPAVGVDLQGMEAAAQSGDEGAVLAHAAVPMAIAASPLAIEGAVKALKPAASMVLKPANKIVPAVLGDSVKPLAELTSTTPERIAELQAFPGKVESIRNTVVAAEKQAHQAASNAFPKFDKPIQVGEQTTTFKALQEQRSNLLQDIAAEKRAVNAGNASRFDLAKMYEKLSNLDETMNNAALEQGGPEGLAKLQAARKQFGKYMNDFHNSGSPLRKLLDTKPGETGKVINHLLSPDSGARSIETLAENGVDVTPIRELVSQGDRPLRVSVSESAKLRKAGSVDAYTKQRILESLSQAKFNELPGSAQARLPQGAMKNQAAGFLKQIPLADRITPRNVTRVRLERALQNR